MSAAQPGISGLSSIALARGAHPPDDVHCAMELAAILAGEPWSDAPACVAPTLCAYTLPLNDAMPAAVRQRLLPYAPLLIGTAPEPLALAVRRALLCADHAVRVLLPLALDAAGHGERATALRALPAVTDAATAHAAEDAAWALHQEAEVAWGVSWVAWASRQEVAQAALWATLMAACAVSAAWTAATMTGPVARSAEQAAADAAAAAAAASRATMAADAAAWSTRAARLPNGLGEPHWDAAFALLDALLAAEEAA